jgi:amino acid adenylation domain-containing protein
MAYLLHHQFCEAALKFPAREAVCFKDQSVCYKELDEITNKLAHVIQQNGVKCRDRVGIYMHKSIFSVISILGILKSGATYVPLDPNTPSKRLAYIIENCGIKMLLASADMAGNVNKICLDSCPLDIILLTGKKDDLKERLPIKVITWEDVTTYNDSGLPTIDTIDTDLAYILYTSGSTGDPKGVMISHLNALTFINWAFKAFGIIPEDRLSNHAPLHFDLSIFDIFVALKAGAAVLPVPEEASSFPYYLAQWIEANRISVWYSVPSILSMMLLHGQLIRFSYKYLRTILFAGEVFPLKYLRNLMGIIQNTEYYNLYGPTETNVVTYYKVPQLEPDRIKPIPIGKACENTEVFAIMKGNKLVTKPGQEGELYARGSCVAQGYWGDNEKTIKSFVKNPFQNFYQERIYKIGDIVTLDDQGNYIYIGRRDQMIKSRGYRIELGEIEAALYAHPEINDAAVVAIPDELIGNRIKAFLVCRKKDSISYSEVKAHCSTLLPRYMIPEIIEFQDTLARTSTGKIDRKLLSRSV